MTIFIGTDEAGYGPNLGPLLIAGTAWRVPYRQRAADLYEVLSACLGRDPAEAVVAIADSKLLYKPGGGLAGLERGVLPAAALTCGLPERWREAWQLLAPESVAGLERAPWYQQYDTPLPCACAADQLQSLAAHLQQGLQQCRVELLRVKARALFPSDFNDQVERLGSKGAALSEATLQLVRALWEPVADQQVIVQCDKHGGRNHYAALLQHHFPEHLVRVVRESREISIYRWGPRSPGVEFRFVARGESFMPAALASMTAKYLRELAMQAFNAFWQQHLPELRATAGYPTDAHRFRAEIQPMQARLGIADHMLWRGR